jgi:hypothetical protein
MSAFHEPAAHPAPPQVRGRTRLLANCVVRLSHLDDDKENFGLSRLLSDAIGNRQWTAAGDDGASTIVMDVS